MTQDKWWNGTTYIALTIGQITILPIVMDFLHTIVYTHNQNIY